METYFQIAPIIVSDVNVAVCSAPSGILLNRVEVHSVSQFCFNGEASRGGKRAPGKRQHYAQTDPMRALGDSRP